jgi:hypothetical protein
VSKNRVLRPADTVFRGGEAARSSALGLRRVRIYQRTVSEALTQEKRRLIRDADDLVRCLPIEFEIKLCPRPTVFPVIERLELSASHRSLGKRRASDGDTHARRLARDAALLRSGFGMGHYTARNGRLPSGRRPRQAVPVCSTAIENPVDAAGRRELTQKVPGRPR